MTKRTTKVTILSALLAGGLSAGGWIAGCSTDPVESGPPSQNLGNVSIGLVVGVDVTLNTVTYTITGPAGFNRTGSIDVSNSSTVNAIISGIPFGTGYQIALKGTTTDGLGICMGSATFDVTSTATVTVPVGITCNLQPQTGSIVVNGVLNACPRIDAVGASPANTAVGGTMALTATAVDVDHGPSPLTYSWTANSGTIDNPSSASANFTCTQVGMVTVTLAASDGDPACASQQSIDVVCTEPQAQSPIKHVIVLIGENRSFDHTFGTYVPKSGQTISNLLSKGIVNADGTPGPNFAVSAQSQAAAQTAFWIAPDSKSPYAILPPPSTSGAPSAQRPTAPPFQTTAQAAFETDIFPADINLVTTGATGLPARTVDTRVTNAANLPNGSFQLTGPTMPYDSYTGDIIHRFYQMWQQADCSAANITATNPSGCVNDLFPFVGISFSTSDNGVGSSMAFTNVQQGDMPFLTMLANSYTLSDNMHQSFMGGTGADHSMAGFGDAVTWTDGTTGSPATPPASLIANPNPKSGTNNNYTVDGNFSNCSDPTQPGVAPILGYLASLPNHPNPNCAPNTYYYLNNTNPTFDPHGNIQSGTVVPPTNQKSIADSLNAKGISWKFYGGGFNTNLGYCQICNPFEYQAQIMGDPASVAAHQKDTTDMYTDIANGTLPSVSYAHPDGVMDGHPSSSKLDLYESYVKNILVKLQANPALAASTAVMVTFDEGGGYYDSGYIQPLDFFGDGTRIPLIIVSPYTTGGKVNHGYADHVSILKFIEKNWSLQPITGRSRDNLPNPQTTADNPYVPTNSPALTDLWDAFDFNQ
ncbi:MAG TPA: alkaline phosphatase family protein [Polyangia bacterium]|nr:alkaline phosphatase family protein [Polyangia bacterium]